MSSRKFFVRERLSGTAAGLRLIRGKKQVVDGAVPHKLLQAPLAHGKLAISNPKALRP